MVNDMKIVVVGSREKRIETESETFEELPLDYKNWSSAVISFKENEDITVYAFACDNCCMYYVLSYEQMASLFFFH